MRHLLSSLEVVIMMKNTINHTLFFVGDCTFESGACGWGNANSDDDDWVLMRGNYTGSRTHPSGDHTFGVSQGGFMFETISCYLYLNVISDKGTHFLVHFGKKKRLIQHCHNIYLPKFKLK